MIQSENPAPAPSPADRKFALKAHFDDMAPNYHGFGPVWHEVAQQMLSLNPIPIDANSIVHDNGCGTGQVSLEIVNEHQSSLPQICATDWSAPMIKHFNERDPPLPVTASVLDSEDLSPSFADESFTHSICSLVLMASSNPAQIAKEIYRTLKTGGVSLSSIWASRGWVDIASTAVHKIRPDAPAAGPPMPPEYSSAGFFKSLFTGAGFDGDKIEIHKTKVVVKLADMNKEAREHFSHIVLLWSAQSWSEDERNRLFGELMKGFSPETADVDSFEHEVWICVARK